jgi:2'-5' RNA ligase
MSESKRLFFAIELPAPYSGKSFAGAPTLSRSRPPVAAANLHLTLAFLGDVSAEKQRALAAMAGRLPSRFTLHLDDAGQWLRSRVVWLGTRQPPRGLQLAICCAPGGAQRLLSKPAAVSSAYHPAARCRSGRCHPAAGFSLDLSGQHSRFMNPSLQGRTRYTPLQRWTLGDTRNSDEV